MQTVPSPTCLLLGRSPAQKKKKGGGQSGHELRPVRGVGSQCIRTDYILWGKFSLWLGYDKGP